MNRRLRTALRGGSLFGPGGPPGSFPLEPNTGQESIAEESALVPWEARNRKISVLARDVVPFDYQAIANLAPTGGPPSGTVITLIGTNIVPGVVNSTPIPTSTIAVITGVFPYLEGGAGPIRQPRIPGAGVVPYWSVQVNGQPDNAYGAIKTMLSDGLWSAAMSGAPLVYLRSGEQLTAVVSITDPGALYNYAGIRIVGRVMSLDAFQRLEV